MDLQLNIRYRKNLAEQRRVREKINGDKSKGKNKMKEKKNEKKTGSSHAGI